MTGNEYLEVTYKNYEDVINNITIQQTNIMDNTLKNNSPKILVFSTEKISDPAIDLAGLLKKKKIRFAT